MSTSSSNGGLRKASKLLRGAGLTLFALVCGSTCPRVKAQTAERKPGADFKAFLTSTFSVETLVVPAVTAAGSQFVFKPAGFEDGAEGYGHHYGISLADNVNGKFMRKFVFAAASGHPDLYLVKENGSIFGRFLNAAGHTLFVDPQARKKSFNWSGLPASFVSAAISNTYQPSNQRTWSATLQRAGTNSGGYLFGDVLSEFRSLGCRIAPLHAILKCK